MSKTLGDEGTRDARARTSHLDVRSSSLALVLILSLCLPLASWAAEDAARTQGLSLEECLELALANHPSLRKARGNVRSEAAALERVKSANRATLGLTGSLRREGDLDESFRDGASSGNVGLTASKLLYDTGRNRLQREIQREALLGAQEGERSTRISVAASAKRAYFDLVLKILDHDVEREKLENLEAHLETAKGFYDVGTSSFIDVTKAEADVASARTSLLKAQSDILVSQEALKMAMGIETDGPFDLALSTELLLPKAAGGMEHLLSAALEDRPDYRQALHAVRSRELGVKSAAREGSPTITGTASSTFTDREGASSSTGYGVGVSLNVPIVDGGATAAAVEAARAALDQAEADLDGLRQQVGHGVRSAALSLDNALERVRSAEVGVRYAEENLALARGRYDVGVGDALELSDAVSQLANARYAHYQALYDAQTARADLDEAMGRFPPELGPTVTEGE